MGHGQPEVLGEAGGPHQRNIELDHSGWFDRRLACIVGTEQSCRWARAGWLGALADLCGEVVPDWLDVISKSRAIFRFRRMGAILSWRRAIAV